ncbi:MAG: nitric oxide reductase activation protein NorD [Enterococcus sp.]
MLEWEEHTFLGIKSLYQRLVTRPREKAAAAVRIHLHPHRQTLFLLAQIAASKPVTLFETEDPILCDHERIFLPPAFDICSTPEANLDLYRTKTLLAGLAIRHRWNQPLADHLLEIGQTFPLLPERIFRLATHFETPEDLWETLGTPRQSADVPAEEKHALETGNSEDTEPEDLEITEIQGRGQLNIQPEDDHEDDGIGYEMPIHTFEKAETLEEHSGLSRRNDQDDELHDHEEALRQINMTHVLRSHERPRSIYRADVLLESFALEADASPSAEGIPYPEWNHKKRQMRQDWCRLRESRVPSPDPDWLTDPMRRHQGLILSLKKSFARLANERLRAKKQPTGSEFDIDALIENRIGWQSGQAADENIYIEKHRRLHDVAALVLLDRSYSTDGYIDGRRVLDVIRETMLCTGEVLDTYLETFGVAAFSSDTRHHCAFDWVKPFAAPWITARTALSGLHAAGYTRIGTPLRHAQELLVKLPAERKVIILITDGRPCDYDRYEGAYGVHDVKHAIATGRANNIDTHAFAIETRARETFPSMFSRDHFHIVPKPAALTTSLCELFAKLRTR